MKLFLIVSVLSLSFILHAVEEKPITVVIPSYNNERWAKTNILSVLNQNYSNYRVIYINDCSSDKTKEKAENLIRQDKRSRSYLSLFFRNDDSNEITETTAQFIKEINSNRVFFTLVSNQSRSGALANQYRAISSCHDDEIIVLLDGDDWFADHKTLQKINEAYSSCDIWMTHGSLVEYPTGTQAWSESIPDHIIASNTFRNFKCPSHLRTFYAWIFKRIRLEDLLYNGTFFSMTSDMAIMYPIAEMCGERHRFIQDPLYIYNMSNPINDNKVDAELQRTLDRYIRGKPPYQRLENR